MVQYIEGIPIMVVNDLQERIRKSKALGVLRGVTVEQLATTTFKASNNEEMELEESIYDIEEDEGEIC